MKEHYWLPFVVNKTSSKSSSAFCHLPNSCRYGIVNWLNIFLNGEFMEKIISTENLIFKYPAEEGTESEPAVKDITIDIAKGSFTAIIGRNGSGKSTIAKTFNALLLPTEGAVYVKGYDTKDADRLWDIRQTAGMVFQNPDNQLVSSIVEDDVAFGPENIGIKSEDIRGIVDEALFAVDMYDFRKKAPHMLSGGQKQRIAIAGVIAMKPECIIFDEPTAMLDPKGRSEVMAIIRKLHSEGITVILITHFMEEAADADRIVIMNNGNITADGTPQEVFSDRAAIESAGLRVPMAADIAEALRAKGINLPAGIIGTEELVNAICQLK